MSSQYLVSVHVDEMNHTLTFASLGALEPRVIEIWVACNATLLMPSAVRSATTGFARILDRAAFGAWTWRSSSRSSCSCSSDGGCSGRCGYWRKNETHTDKLQPLPANIELHIDCINQTLTIASLNALEPRIIKIWVALTSTLLIPSAVWSATTAFAKFLGAAFGA